MLQQNLNVFPSYMEYNISCITIMDLSYFQEIIFSNSMGSQINVSSREAVKISKN